MLFTFVSFTDFRECCHATLLMCEAAAFQEKLAEISVSLPGPAALFVVSQVQVARAEL